MDSSPERSCARKRSARSFASPCTRSSYAKKFRANRSTSAGRARHSWIRTGSLPSAACSSRSLPGILDARITVHGRAAHAGVEPEKGRNAILAAADLVQRIHGLNGRWPGVTFNVGVVAGGTRPNVVAERCELEVDVRAVRREDLEAAEAAIRDLLTALVVPDTTAEMTEMARWWPMEKLERSGRLVDHAVALANRLGFEVRDTSTGGASDANSTAGMGIPSLDGLGPIGGNDHSPAEYLDVASIVPRTTLVAALLLAIGRDPVVLGWRAGTARG